MGSAEPARIAIFASGGGSNAQAIIDSPYHGLDYEVVSIVTNKKNAGVIDRARAAGIDYVLINRQTFYESQDILLGLQEIDVIVLAGFLWLVPAYLVSAYEKRIINIHPALLPDYGGKGMYGKHVHEAVWRDRCQYSGLTIHLVNEKYDEGSYLFQARVDVSDAGSSEEIAARVLQAEHRYYPQVVRRLCQKLL